jgi:zinc transporter ZupT
MLAASYWCLLAPAIEMAEESGVYSSFAFVPVSIGFVAGAAFVYLADILLSYLVSEQSIQNIIEFELWNYVAAVVVVEPFSCITYFSNYMYLVYS